MPVRMEHNTQIQKILLRTTNPLKLQSDIDNSQSKKDVLTEYENNEMSLDDAYDNQM